MCSLFSSMLGIEEESNEYRTKIEEKGNKRVGEPAATTPSLGGYSTGHIRARQNSGVYS